MTQQLEGVPDGVAEVRLGSDDFVTILRKFLEFIRWVRVNNVELFLSFMLIEYERLRDLDDYLD